MRYELGNVGLDFTRLAAAANPPLTNSAFTKAARVPIPRAQAIIAAALGLSPLAIWPSRYDPATGKSVRRVDWLAARGLDVNGIRRRAPAQDAA